MKKVKKEHKIKEADNLTAYCVKQACVNELFKNHFLTDLEYYQIMEKIKKEHKMD